MEDSSREREGTGLHQPPMHGSSILLAGPGTGKTTLLTERAKFVLDSTRGEKTRVLALTYTNRAAGEMRARLRGESAEYESRIYIGTFHSFATHVLRSHGNAIGLNSDFVIFDQSDQSSVLKDLQADGELSQGLDIDSVVAAFSRLKSRGLLASGPETGTSDIVESLREVHDKYRERLARSNALDFGDLITECLRLFRENPAILGMYRIAYPFVLVDAFQDTTPAQFEMLKLLVNPADIRVFAVADEDQLIFEWNEARLETLNLYLEEFKANVTYSSVSHRCPPAVVEAANSVISNNRFRFQSKLAIQTYLREKGTIVLYRARNEANEAAFVSEKVAALRDEGIPFSEIGVIARARRLLEPVAGVLLEANIPAGQPSTAGFGDDEEGQMVLRLLRWLQNPRDEQSARKVILFFRPSLSTLFDELVRTGARQGLSVEAALSEAPEDEAGTRVRSVLADLTQWRLLTRDTERLIEAIRLGLPKFIDDPERIDSLLIALDGMENLRRESFSSTHVRLTDFLAELPILVGSSTVSRTISIEGGAVSLLTYHQAKGLEFSGVFLIGLEDGIFPDFRSADDSRAMEEERRLFYVGITRAKRYLFLTFSDARSTASGRIMSRERSRFIDEIPEHLLTYVPST